MRIFVDQDTGYFECSAFGWYSVVDRRLVLVPRPTF